MDEPLRRPRCECCDEVLQELLSLRQNFDKYFQRFNTQIVQMRREISSIMSDKQKATKSKNNNFDDNVSDKETNATGKRKNNLDPLSSTSLKTRRCEYTQDVDSVDDEDHNDTDNISNGSGVAQISNTGRKSRSSSIRSESRMKQEPNMSPSYNNQKSPITTFLGINLRVLPTLPFKSDTEFEAWEQLLRNDSDQRDRLRSELLQGKFDDPEKFIRHIWRSVLTDEAAQGYTYKGNVKSDKKAIKDYNFTAIFSECFIQRYSYLDAFFFMDRTMRFLHYAHDRIRRLAKGQKQVGHEQTTAELQKEEVWLEDVSPNEDTYGGNNFTDYNYERPVTVNDFYMLQKDFNELNINITNELKQQYLEIYNLMAGVFQDKANFNRSNIEQHSYSFIPEKRSDAICLLPKTPFSTVEEFKIFEKTIEQEKEKFEELVYQFMQLSANGSIKFIKVCWRKLLTDGAAQHLCWKGTDKKEAIRALCVTAALKTAYERKYMEHSDIEFERTCMMFFQHAKNRHKKKEAYQAYQNLTKTTVPLTDHSFIDNPDVKTKDLL